MISERSRTALTGVHPDLVRVIEAADAAGAKFVVVCGRRTLAEQKVLVATGKSKTMHSRHLTGHAVDLVDEGFSWNEGKMVEIAAHVKAAAKDVGIPVEWGGDWKSFHDTPHFQLPLKEYPDGDAESHVKKATPVAPMIKPLAKSRTLWNIGVGTSFLTWLGGLLSDGLHLVTEAGSRFAELAPAREMLATIGGNGSAIAWALGVGCLISAACVNIGDKTPAKPPAEDAA